MTQKEMASEGGKTMTPKRLVALRISIKKAHAALKKKREEIKG